MNKATKIRIQTIPSAEGIKNRKVEKRSFWQIVKSHIRRLAIEIVNFFLDCVNKKGETINSLIMQKFRRDHVNGLPILVILAGESGAGKTTFAKAMDCEENWFESSRAIKEELKQRGEPVNHDTIHAFAQKAYEENLYWQVPNILNALRGKQFLILDGPRQVEEVKALIKEHPNTIIVRIFTPEATRLKRLKNRDKINQEDFIRIVKDEYTETKLSRILSLVDLTIENNGTIEDIQREALEFLKFLQTLTSIDK